MEIKQGYVGYNAQGLKFTGTAYPKPGATRSLVQSGGSITIAYADTLVADLIVATTGAYISLIAYRKSDNVFRCETYNSSGIEREDVTVTTSSGLIWPVSPDLSLGEGRTWQATTVETWS